MCSFNSVHFSIESRQFSISRLIQSFVVNVGIVMLNWPAAVVAGAHKSITKILSPSCSPSTIILCIAAESRTVGSLLNVGGGGCRLLLLLFSKSENRHCSMVKILLFLFSLVETQILYTFNTQQKIKSGKSYQLYSKSDDGSAQFI